MLRRISISYILITAALWCVTHVTGRLHKSASSYEALHLPNFHQMSNSLRSKSLNGSNAISTSLHDDDVQERQDKIDEEKYLGREGTADLELGWAANTTNEQENTSKKEDDASMNTQFEHDAQQQRRQIMNQAERETQLIAHDAEGELALDEKTAQEQDASERRRADEEDALAAVKTSEADAELSEAEEMITTIPKHETEKIAPAQGITQPEVPNENELPANNNSSPVPHDDATIVASPWIESRIELGQECGKPETHEKCAGVKEKLERLEAEEQSLENEEAEIETHEAGENTNENRSDSEANNSSDMDSQNEQDEAQFIALKTYPSAVHTIARWEENQRDATHRT